MTPERIDSVTQRYASLRIAIIGDFCLDRYLEIDPARNEISIETGLPVYNVTNVRSQPGAAGTILNNLVALGIGDIFPVGFAGEDGEGFELLRSLGAKPGVRLDYFLQTNLRRTFTYTKPLVLEPGKIPVELNRLDFKNWSPTPAKLREQIQRAVAALVGKVDACIVLDQVDLAETGVVTSDVLETIDGVLAKQANLFIIADSRRSLKGFPPLAFKMNKAEFRAFSGTDRDTELDTIQTTALELAKQHRRHVFITMSEQGILGASPTGEVAYRPSLPLRGEIDIVGAGDAVTANLTAALSAGASLGEALELAMLAASIVVHQLGTTGTASVPQLKELHHAAGRS